MADNPPTQALAASPVVAPKSVVLLVDDQQVRTMRNTFVFWEFVTLGLGVYIGKKIFEPSLPPLKVSRK